MERQFSSLLMLGGVCFLALATATLTSILKETDIRSERYRQNMDSLSNFVRSVPGLDQTTHMTIFRHFRYTWKQNLITDDSKAILSQMPVHLKSEVALALHFELISESPFLFNKPDDFVAGLLASAHFVEFEAGDLVGRKRDVVQHLFIVKNGVIEAISERHTIMSFVRGSTLGEVGLLLCRYWPVEMRAGTRCEALRIDAKEIDALWKLFPQVQEEMMIVARERNERLKIAVLRRRNLTRRESMSKLAIESRMPNRVKNWRTLRNAVVSGEAKRRISKLEVAVEASVNKKKREEKQEERAVIPFELFRELNQNVLRLLERLNQEPPKMRQVPLSPTSSQTFLRPLPPGATGAR
jgi:CRP-like cAMP-binding protein